MTRKQWSSVHRIAGFYLAILLCFVLVTGTLAVVSHELDYLTNPAMRAQSTNNPVNWSQTYRVVSRYIPAGHRIVQLHQPEHNGFAIEALVINTQGQRYRVYVDPVSYDATGTGRWMNWQNSLRRLHRHLMLPLGLGVTLVSSLAVLLLASLLSGWILVPNWKKVLWQWPRRKNSRLFWADIHKLSGAWSSWLIVVIGLTGLWYLVEQNGLKASYAPAPVTRWSAADWAQSKEALVAQITQAEAAIALQRPGFTPTAWYLPNEAGDALRIDGRQEGILVRDRANSITIDPLTGQWLTQRFAYQLNLHHRISEAADPLHFGTWGGYPTKLLYVGFGLLLSSLCLTGTYLYALRFVRVRDKPTQWHLLKTGVKKMGVWGAVSSAGIVMAALLYLQFIAT